LAKKKSLKTSERIMSVKKKLELLGWGLFTAGSGIYLINSLLLGDWTGAAGSLTFLGGCIVFLISEKF